MHVEIIGEIDSTPKRNTLKSLRNAQDTGRAAHLQPDVIIGVLQAAEITRQLPK